jgi:hypothetical protein
MQDSDDEPARCRGILLPTALLNFESSPSSSSSKLGTTGTTRTKSSIADIQARFPQRERQILKLAALMEVALEHSAVQQQATTRTTFVPAPIFITGGAGTGKTCITLELLRHYHHHHQQQQEQEKASSQAGATNPNSATAAAVAASPPPVPIISYLDCATLDANTVDEVVRQAVYDLQQQQYAQSKHHRHQQQSSRHRGSGKKKKKKKNKKCKMAQTVTGAGLGHDNQSATKRLKSPPPSTAKFGNEVVQLELATTTGANDSQKESTNSIESSQMELDDQENNPENKVESCTQDQRQQQQQIPDRRRSLARVAKQQQQDEHLQSKKYPAKIQHNMKQANKRKSNSSSMTAQDIAASSENAMSHSTAPTAAWKLGRLWKRALITTSSGGGVGSSGTVGSAGFWVIDQAHCLFALQMSRKQQQQQQNQAEKPNLLAQILLLPQTLGLNLTIIVISNHLFLDQTRTWSTAAPYSIRLLS